MRDVRILIVEDEGIEALNIQRRLASTGYPTPEIVLSGEEAIEKAGELRPDVVLMDIMLHGEIDGVMAAEQIRARYDIPVIYLTAYTDEDTLKRAKITEPYGYIVKPFRDREIHIAIDMALYKHKIERERREREKWFSTTLRSIGDAVIATDKDGRITFMNVAAERLMGWRQEELLNIKLTDVFRIINSKTRQPVESPAIKALTRGTIIDMANHTVLIAKDGREISIDESAAPIRDDEDNIIGAILVFHDVTERERAEEALRKANDELERRVAERTADLALTNENLKQEIEQRRQAEYKLAERNLELENATMAKHRFLATMSHELQITLNNIISFAGTLLQREPWPLSQHQVKQAQMIRNSAQHLQSLIYYLLDLAKIESGKVEMMTEPVEVTGMLHEVVSIAKPVAQQKGLKFTDNIPEREIILHTHRRAVSHILLNLTDNAIKFTDRGSVHLSFAQHQTGKHFVTEFSVADTGTGIRDENQKLIFEAFAELDGGGALRPREGTGLGLHLSQKLAELIGGEISLKSTYGKGSTFTLTLK
ncbi:MAG: PAS domain S-box protein [Chloroflexi bacterium]|nr:PAS domain S-box protein [Chloroflexota bacterium]